MKPKQQWPPAEWCDLDKARGALVWGVRALETALARRSLEHVLADRRLHDAVGPSIVAAYGAIAAEPDLYLGPPRERTVDQLLEQAVARLAPPVRTFPARLEGKGSQAATLRGSVRVLVSDPAGLSLRLDQAIGARFWGIGFQWDDGVIGDPLALATLRAVAEGMAADLRHATRIHNRNHEDPRFPDLIPPLSQRRYERLMHDILDEHHAVGLPATLEEDFLQKTDLHVRFERPNHAPTRARVQVTSLTSLTMHEAKLARIYYRENFVILSPVALADFLEAELQGRHRFHAPLPDELLAALRAEFGAPTHFAELVDAVASRFRTALARPAEDPRGPLAQVPEALRSLVRLWTLRSAFRSHRLVRARAVRRASQRVSIVSAPPIAVAWREFQGGNEPGSRISVKFVQATAAGYRAVTPGGIDVCVFADGIVDAGAPAGLAQLDAKAFAEAMPLPLATDALLGAELPVLLLDVCDEQRLATAIPGLAANPGPSPAQVFLAGLQPGAVVRGTVVRVRAVEARVEVSGAIASLHAAEMSWVRTPDLREVLQVGQELDVVVLEVAAERDFLVVSRKQLEPSPWQTFAEQNPPGTRRTGIVQKVLVHSVLVEFESGLRGRLPVDEMSWEPRPNVAALHTVGDRIEVVVMAVDVARQRIALSRKPLLPNAWADLPLRLPVGAIVVGVVVRVLSIGVIVRVEPGVEGLVHESDWSFTRRQRGRADLANVGDELRLVVLSIDMERRRLGLGRKQTMPDPWAGSIPARYHLGYRCTGTVNTVVKYGAFVELEPELEGLLHISGLPDPLQPPASVLAAGMLVEVEVVLLEPAERRIGLKLVSSDFPQNAAALAVLAAARTGSDDSQ